MPKANSDKIMFYGTGRRKSSIARVRLVPGAGKITINSKDYRTDFLSLEAGVQHTNYPIVNNKNECLGLLKITSADHYLKQPVIMVDHNSFSQSAIGIEEAEITEIIDHHNLGAIGTNVPINFRSMPVGCTCTIIYYMFLERKVAIPKNIAGLMLSAILSDTMIFKSPTTTLRDKEAAMKLAKIAKVDIDKYGYEMFKAASSIEGISVNDLINQDMKAYNVGNFQFGISQVMTMDFNEIEKNIDEYINKLDELKNDKFLCVVLFITDVYKNGSYVLYNREEEDIIKDAFDLKDVYEGVYIDNLVSRMEDENIDYIFVPRLCTFEDKKTICVKFYALYDICKNSNKAVVVVTHNSALKDMADRVILIKNGQIVAEEENRKPKKIEEIEW